MASEGYGRDLSEDEYCRENERIGESGMLLRTERE
jgi:hypothetical protein